MICKLCGQNKELIKAHIIPNSFIADLRGENSHLSRIPSQRRDDKVGKSAMGEYDTEILCRDCDNALGRFDDYGKKVLIEQENELKPILNGETIEGWSLEIQEPIKLKTFILSVLWRASISNRAFCKLVNLRVHEDRIKEEILSGCENSIYEVYVFKYKESKLKGAEKSIMNPDSVKMEELNFCRIFVHGYIFMIKVDKRNAPKKMKNFSIAENKIINIVSIEFDTSKEVKELLKVYSKIK